MFNNLSISTRLSLLTGAALLAVVLTALVGMTNNRRLNEEISFSNEAITRPLAVVSGARGDFNAMRTGLFDLAQGFNSTGQNEEYKRQVMNYLANYEGNIRAYKGVLDNYGTDDPYESDAVNYLYTQLDPLRAHVEYIAEVAGRVGRGADAILLLRGGFLNAADDTTQELKILTDILEAQSKLANRHAEELQNANDILSLLIASISAFTLILASYSIAKSITEPMQKMTQVSEDLSKGNLAVNIAYRSKNEIGVLADSFRRLISVYQNMISDLQNMTEKQYEGDIDFFIDAKAYNGAYFEMVTGINTMMQTSVSDLRMLIEYLRALANGNFGFEITRFPGKKSVINQSLDEIRSNLSSVHNGISELAAKVSSGILDHQIDAEKYNGDWLKLMRDLNSIITAVREPLNESLSVIRAMEYGDFSKRATGDYKGEFLVMKNALNTTLGVVSSYIDEINATLSLLAEGDLTADIEREFIGQFESIKSSINAIVKSLKNTMGDIASASGKVLNGAKQFSNSSITLAQGATEQTAAIQELIMVMNEIDRQSKDNANNAKQAAALSATSKDNAETGSNEMQQLLLAMEGITDSSQKISNIIKTIEDIAFQTNLLALNAAVEAARAGEHGKGFSVVSSEVRSLAEKSRQAARQTSALIQESINRVDEGMKRADETANSLEKIVGNIIDVSEVTKKIHVVSAQQTEAVEQAGHKMELISEVVHINSATSEESAASSEELQSQAETLKQMISFFKTAAWDNSLNIMEDMKKSG